MSGHSTPESFALVKMVFNSVFVEAASQLWQTLLKRPLPLKRRLDDEAREYRYKIRAPWPQPNPHAPERLAPSVLHLPKAELRDFVKVTVGRLRHTLRWGWIEALAFARRNPEVPPITDDELVQYLTQTLFSRVLSDEIEPSDQVVLSALMDIEGTLYKMDLSPAGLLEPLPGTYVAGCIVYFSRRAPQERYVPVGMLFPGRDGAEPLFLTPADGDAWELGKHFALQAASNNGLFGNHPLVHFPPDAINALTKSTLPPEHVLARLLLPHMYIQLCLNFSVMFIDKSPLHNDQNYYWTGLTNSGASSALKITQAHYSGIEGSTTYPGFAWPREPATVHSDYGDFINGYYRIINDFVGEVLADVSLDDPHVQRWVSECARHVRGFPDIDEMRDGDRFVSTVSYIIFNAAINHSVDHYSFGSIPVLKMSLRMRVPPPASRVIPPLDRSTFTTLEDRFRIYLTYKMHIIPSTQVGLGDVDYGFDDPRLRDAQARFMAQLKAYDADPGVTRHAPLEDIACSIQY